MQYFIFTKCPRLTFHCQKWQNYANRTHKIFWGETQHKHSLHKRQVEKCKCAPRPSRSQSLHVHNSVSEEDLLLLDVLICMDLKKGRGGFYDIDDWMRPWRRAGKGSSLIRRWGWTSGKKKNKKPGTVIYNSGNSGWKAVQNDSVQMEWYVEVWMEIMPVHVVNKYKQVWSMQMDNKSPGLFFVSTEIW